MACASFKKHVFDSIFVEEFKHSLQLLAICLCAASVMCEQCVEDVSTELVARSLIGSHGEKV